MLLKCRHAQHFCCCCMTLQFPALFCAAARDKTMASAHWWSRYEPARDQRRLCVRASHCRSNLERSRGCGDLGLRLERGRSSLGRRRQDLEATARRQAATKLDFRAHSLVRRQRRVRDVGRRQRKLTHLQDHRRVAKRGGCNIPTSAQNFFSTDWFAAARKIASRSAIRSTASSCCCTRKTASSGRNCHGTKCLPRYRRKACSQRAIRRWRFAATDLFFGTGGPAARVFHSADLGTTWTVAETPIVSGNASSGIFSLRCSGDTIVAVGGDYANTNVPMCTCRLFTGPGRNLETFRAGTARISLRRRRRGRAGRGSLSGQRARTSARTGTPLESLRLAGPECGNGIK